MTATTHPVALPPHYSDPCFLGAEQHAAMLDWALTNRDRFEPSLIQGDVLDPARRASLSLRDLGPLADLLRTRLRDHLPLLVAGTGTRPFELDSIELELVAYGEGAHFEPHRDIPIGDVRAAGTHKPRKADRMLSAVYYFFREPKGFTGGELRLHRFGSNGAPGDYLDVSPAQNSLVAFPSWVTHEVLRVCCPSRNFEDYRFAVNCWLRRPAATAR